MYAIDKRTLTNPYLLGALAKDPKTNVRIAERRAVFEAEWTARPYRSPVTRENQNTLLHMTQFTLVTEPPLLFNWVARRDPVWLVSGDLPRMALATIRPEPGSDPDHLCLGDVRIRLTVGDETFWLHERGRVRTRYMPGAIRHEVALTKPVCLWLTVDAFLVENVGIGVRASVRGGEAGPMPVMFDYVVGGMRFDPSCAILARYLRIAPDDYPWHIPQRVQAADRIACRGATAILSNPDVSPYRAWTAGEVRARVMACPWDEETRDFVVYRHQLIAKPEPLTVRLLVATMEGADSVPLRMEHFEMHETRTRHYYDDMLASCHMETPDEVLDAGFHSAVVNLDYEFHDFAWLEGVHQWNCYWANNYQIRAALLLGQTVRVREALIALATREGGPGNPRAADGSPFGGAEHQDALPYYIVSLWRYWQATEDRETLGRVWSAVTGAMENWLTVYDPDRDGLLHWHKGVNSFMYQGDHHRLPGAGFSPSVMAAFTLDCLAEMAEGLGGDPAESAPAWRRRAIYIRGELMRRMWLPDEGRFAGCVDPQGRRHKAAYYTDFAFPILFSNYPPPIKWLCMQAMDRMLALGNELLRTGTLKPDAFGNNVPHVTSNCEGAEAFFEMGRAERATDLLRGACRATATFTHSPGAVPEFIGLRGEGLIDYLFGPPTGSLLLGVIRGLWGVERAAANRPFEWRPAAPAEWEQGRLSLPGMEVSIQGVAADRMYALRLSEPQPARLRLPLFGRTVGGVADGDGAPLAHRMEAHPSGGFVWVETPAASEHVVRVTLGEAQEAPSFPKDLRPGERVDAELPGEGWRLNDPQRVFTEFVIEGSAFHGRVADGVGVGDRTLFLEHRADPPAMQAVTVAVRSPELREAAGKEGPLILKGERIALSLDAHFNDSNVPVSCWPPLGEPRFVSGPEVNDPIEVEIGPYRFRARDKAPRLVRLEVGGLISDGAKANAVSLSTHTFEKVRLPVGKRVHGIEVLLVAHVESRLTGMRVAECVFTYDDGFEARTPMVFGREVDHASFPFATRTAVKALPCEAHLGWPWFASAFALPARSDRPLDHLELRVTALTATLGVFAVNAVV